MSALVVAVFPLALACVSLGLSWLSSLGSGSAPSRLRQEGHAYRSLSYPPLAARTRAIEALLEIRGGLMTRKRSSAAAARAWLEDAAKAALRGAGRGQGRDSPKGGGMHVGAARIWLCQTSYASGCASQQGPKRWQIAR